VPELDVLKLVSKGESKKVIRDQLGITESAVKMHGKRLLKKRQAPGQTVAVREAVYRGLVRLA
jgi:DNA-binding CsgD family transcriptional regulator